MWNSFSWFKAVLALGDYVELLDLLNNKLEKIDRGNRYYEVMCAKTQNLWKKNF
jgi:hypothetical protein